MWWTLKGSGGTTEAGGWTVWRRSDVQMCGMIVTSQKTVSAHTLRRRSFYLSAWHFCRVKFISYLGERLKGSALPLTSTLSENHKQETLTHSPLWPWTHTGSRAWNFTLISEHWVTLKVTFAKKKTRDKIEKSSVMGWCEEMCEFLFTNRLFPQNST